MKNFLKKSLIGLGMFACLFIFTSCTKSFCNINDSAVLYGSYVEKNQATIITNAKSSDLIVPSSDYWTYIDNQVDEVYSYVITNDAYADKYAYVPSSYVDSHKQYLSATSEDAKKNLVDERTLKFVIKYTGSTDNSATQTLWANINTWTNSYNKENPTKATTYLFNTFYQTQVKNGVGSTITCFTPESGYFGINKDTYVQGKTWGQAFSEYGFFEGLLVYPIGWLVYTFTNAFGVNGGGQILAIFLVTLICRLIIVLLSAGSYSTQTKMAELQPKLEMLQAKYPNNQSDQYQKSQLTAETMKLYKENKIHPFRQFLVLIVQFPLFICVWGALQGSAILTQGNFFGVSLSTVFRNGMNFNSVEGGITIALFAIITIAQFFAAIIPTWMQSYRKKKIVGAKTVQVEENPTASAMKYMPWIMLVMMVIMQFNLPVAMGIYWFFGALISILQTCITEIVMAYKRGRKPKNKNKNDKFTSYKKKDKKHMSIR